MLRHARNLLLLAALCWVAPASAGQRTAHKACLNDGASPAAMPSEGTTGGSRLFDSGGAFLP